jgi:FkbM family methyltransferase
MLINKKQLDSDFSGTAELQNKDGETLLVSEFKNSKRNGLFVDNVQAGTYVDNKKHGAFITAHGEVEHWKDDRLVASYITHIEDKRYTWIGDDTIGILVDNLNGTARPGHRPELITKTKDNIMTDLRRPTARNCIDYILQCGIKIDTVIDAGVQRGTGFLIGGFPEAHHYLFEPGTHFIEDLENSYKDIKHTTYNIALSNENKIDDIELFHVGETTKIESMVYKTLDSTDIIVGNHTLVKLDVDGHELQVIEGGRETIAAADIIIVEAVVYEREFSKRINSIESLGFRMFDIVDIDYSNGHMGQCDVVFVSDNVWHTIVDACDKLNYMPYQNYRQSYMPSDRVIDPEYD